MRRSRQEVWRLGCGRLNVFFAFLLLMLCQASATVNNSIVACFCDHCVANSGSTKNLDTAEFSEKDVTCDLNSGTEDEAQACFVLVHHTTATEQGLRSLLPQVGNIVSYLQQLRAGSADKIANSEAVIHVIHSLMNITSEETILEPLQFGCTKEIQCLRPTIRGQSFRCCKTPYCNVELLPEIYNEIDVTSLLNSGEQTAQNNDLTIVIVVCVIGSCVLIAVVGVTLHLRNQRLLLRLQESACADGSTQATINASTAGYLPLNVRSSSSSASNLRRVAVNRSHRRTASQRTSRTTLPGSTSVSVVQSVSTLRDEMVSPSVATSWLPATSTERTVQRGGRLEPRTCARDLVFVGLLKAGGAGAADYERLPGGEADAATVQHETCGWSGPAMLIVPSNPNVDQVCAEQSGSGFVDARQGNLDESVMSPIAADNSECSERLQHEQTDYSTEHNGLVSASGAPTGLQAQELYGDALDVESMLDGSVWLGRYRDSLTAVKLYAVGTFGEARWRHAADLLQLTLVRHDNVIGFVGADCAPPPLPLPMRSPSDLTRPFYMLLTEYHRLGSLRDFLVHVHASTSASTAMTARTLVSFAHSLACGLSYLHTDMNGTRGKPAIAHCSLKATHVYVKSDLTLCIGGFDRAVRYVTNRLEVPAYLRSTIDARVPTVAALYGFPAADACMLECPSSPSGTIDSSMQLVASPVLDIRNMRVVYDEAVLYCAPEILTDRLARNDFEAYRRVDMYAFALLLFEIAQAYAVANYSTLLASSDQSVTAEAPSRPIAAYRPPFVDELRTRVDEREHDFRTNRFNEADVDALRELVAERRYRPQFVDALQLAAKHDERLKSLMDLVVYCWLDDPQARLTSLRVKKTLLADLPLNVAPASQPTVADGRS